MVSRRSLEIILPLVAAAVLTFGGIAFAKEKGKVPPKPSVEQVLFDPNCSQLDSFVANSSFNVPKNSWFWQEARNYLHKVGMPSTVDYIKRFEQAFTSVYGVDVRKIDPNKNYNMTPVFEQAGFGDISYDFCTGN